MAADSPKANGKTKAFLPGGRKGRPYAGDGFCGQARVLRRAKVTAKISAKIRLMAAPAEQPR